MYVFSLAILYLKLKILHGIRGQYVQSDIYMNVQKLKILTSLVHLKVNGGPSKKADLLSSEPVAIRNGRDVFHETELMALVWPDKSPFTEAPVSIMNTWANLINKIQ